MLFLTFYVGALLFYFADVLQKLTSNQNNTWGYLFHRSIYTTVIAVVASIIIAGFQNFPDALTVFKIISVSFCCCLGLYFYIKAINSNKFSNVGALSIVGTVFQMLIGFIVFQEPFRIVFIPILLLMSVGNLIQIVTLKNAMGVFNIILSVFFWTIGYTALSRVLQNMNVIWSVPLMELAILMLSGVMVFIKKEQWRNIQSANQLFKIKMVLVAIFIFLGSYLNNIAFQQIPVSVISLLQLSIMPISYLLSLKLFREKPSTIELISFITGFVGFRIVCNYEK